MQLAPGQTRGSTRPFWKRSSAYLRLDPLTIHGADARGICSSSSIGLPRYLRLAGVHAFRAGSSSSINPEAWKPCRGPNPARLGRGPHPALIQKGERRLPGGAPQLRRDGGAALVDHRGRPATLRPEGIRFPSGCTAGDRINDPSFDEGVRLTGSSGDSQPSWPLPPAFIERRSSAATCTSRSSVAPTGDARSRVPSGRRRWKCVILPARLEAAASMPTGRGHGPVAYLPSARSAQPYRGCIS